MAGFKAHLAGGLVLGVGLGWHAHSVGLLGMEQAGAVFVLAAVGSLLPDLDADTGKPLEFLFALVSVLVPGLVVFGMGRVRPELTIVIFTLGFVFMNAVVLRVVKRLTLHRGILHSLPFSALCGALAFLVFIPSGKVMAGYAGVAVLAGVVLHLVLDELASLRFRYGIIPEAKESLGTAFKLRSGSVLATSLVYLALIASVSLIFLRI